MPGPVPADSVEEPEEVVPEDDAAVPELSVVWSGVLA